MTATGFLYRHLLRHPTAPDALSGYLTAREHNGLANPASAAASPTSASEAPTAPPHSAPSETRDAWRSREIAEYLPYARYLATRFGMPAGSYEDVRRVALLGLAEAVDSFDPDAGTTLLAHAACAIQNQVRRHLRDIARSKRAPRRLDELADELPAAVQTLSRHLKRSPTVTEVAVLTDACPEDVVDAIEVADSRPWQCPAWPVLVGAGGPWPAAGDGDLEDLLVDRLRTLLAQLSRRDKQILLLHFLRGMGRTRLCDELDVSPVYVGRLVSAFLAGLRGHLADPPAPKRHRHLRRSSPQSLRPQ